MGFFSGGGVNFLSDFRKVTCFCVENNRDSRIQKRLFKMRMAENNECIIDWRFQ